MQTYLVATFYPILCKLQCYITVAYLPALSPLKVSGWEAGNF